MKLLVTPATLSCRDEDRERLLATFDLLGTIAVSEGFRDAVEGFRRYRRHERLTSEQVYNRLITGDRRGAGDLSATHTADFDYELRYTDYSGTTLGVQSGRHVYTNQWYYRSENTTVADWIGHLMHEVVGHCHGDFHHHRLPSRARKRTVPYAIGRFARKVTKTHLGHKNVRLLDWVP